MDNNENSHSIPSASSSSSSSADPEHAEPERRDPERGGLEQDESSSSSGSNDGGVSYRVNISVSDAPASHMRDEAWSCLVILITFWFFASMTLILGFYSSVNLQLGPYSSRLLQASSIFVQDIKVNAGTEPKPGPMLYGFSSPPPLNVQTAWSESHDVAFPVNFHKEWLYFLNEGSQINISYSIRSKHTGPLTLVIAQGKESLYEWMEDPSYPNTTLSWNVIEGNGWIQQDILKSNDYYVAVGNLNAHVVEVNLNFSIEALLYNTSTAYYKCSLDQNLCVLKLFIFGSNAAVLSSPSPVQDREGEGWFVKLSYGPRWITYFVGSGGLTIIILLAFKFFGKFLSNNRYGTEFQVGGVAAERTPLLTHKDDDISSWGSSYDSVSNDEEDLEDRLAAASLEVRSVKDGETNTPKRLCAICFDAPRDCFFLPCGHCAACLACGARIAEDGGTCPICRRKMKKVRKIFTV